MPSDNPKFVSLKISDPTSGRTFEAKNVPRDALWEQVTTALLENMNAPLHDPEGRDLEYATRLPGEERFAVPKDRVGDDVNDGDSVELIPRTNAG